MRRFAADEEARLADDQWWTPSDEFRRSYRRKKLTESRKRIFREEQDLARAEADLTQLRDSLAVYLAEPEGAESLKVERERLKRQIDEGVVHSMLDPQWLTVAGGAVTAASVVAKAAIDKQAEVRKAEIEAETKQLEIAAQERTAARQAHEETERARIQAQNPSQPPPTPPTS